MNRVMIIGCCGAGKSTFTRALNQKTNLPVYHLDQYYWKPNWEETSKKKWTEIVQSLANKEKWIIDGNYSGTYDIRLNRADTLVYLDYPTWRCFLRVIKRIIKYKGKVRPDMVEGCAERFDLEFLHYVLFFNLTKRKSILRKINAFKDKLKVIILKSDKEVERYFNAGIF